MKKKISPPSSNLTIGLLGGGQLGRMTALAAARLGIRTHIYCPEKDCPASQVTDLFTCANYEDLESLYRFARSVDVISYEFENIPSESIDILEQTVAVSPSKNTLEISQNRLKEKEFFRENGIKTARWAPLSSAAQIPQTLNEWDVTRCVIKTTRFGYDGKGQVKHNIEDDPIKTWEKIGSQELIIEEFIDFAYETSSLVARTPNGETKIFPLAFNEHKDHILWKTTVPAPVPEPIHTQTEQITEKIARALDLKGILAVEFFVTQKGEILANEMAPRSHNSGHWTQDGCTVSQFEQHVRAICNLPLKTPQILAPTTMINLIGEEVSMVEEYLKNPAAAIHLYGKKDVRKGRKMGHINILEINKK